MAVKEMNKTSKKIESKPKATKGKKDCKLPKEKVTKKIESNIVIFSDVDSDLTFEEISKYDIKVLDMPVFIDGEKYNVDYEKNGEFKDFFEAVKHGKKVSTAAMNIEEYKDAFTPYLKEGKDIVYVAFSSGISSTFSNLKMAMSELNEEFADRKICYIDTLGMSVGSGSLAVLAAKRLKEGKSLEEIVKEVETRKMKVKTYFSVSDLIYLKRGGRISGITFTIGKMLGIKPILHVGFDGKVLKLTTANGMNKVIEFFINKIKEELDEKADSLIYILSTDKADPNLKQFKTKLLANLNESLHKKVKISQIGPVIGAHCGPGCLGLVFEGK